jgi:hypothetical protein
MSLLRLLLTLALALPAAALAQGRVEVVALGHPVAVPVPFAGRPAPAPDYTAQDPSGRAFIAEWIPAGERLQAWSQMITLTAQRHPVAPAAHWPGIAEGGIAMLEGRYRAGCARPPRIVPMRATAPNRRAAVLVCAQVGGIGIGEAMVALSVAGPEHLFTLQWAERFPAGGAGPAAEVWAERLRLLGAAGF